MIELFVKIVFSSLIKQESSELLLFLLSAKSGTKVAHGQNEKPANIVSTGI